MSFQLSNSSMNASAAKVWSWFSVVNPHELIAIAMVYGGPIGGFGGFCGAGGRVAMFLYKIIVIIT